MKTIIPYYTLTPYEYLVRSNSLLIKSNRQAYFAKAMVDTERL